jgi:hypothetical protein
LIAPRVLLGGSAGPGYEAYVLCLWFWGKNAFFQVAKKRKKEEKGGRLGYIPGFYVAIKIEPKGRYSSAKSSPKS